MTNENEIILSAIGQKCERRKKKKMREIEPDILSESDETIQNIYKNNRKKTSKRSKTIKKSVNDWNNTDFLRYFQHISSLHGLSISSFSLKDVVNIGKVYDKFVDILADKMDRNIFREYIEWWMIAKAIYYKTSNVGVDALSEDSTIESFIKHYDSSIGLFSKATEQNNNNNTKDNITDEKVYEMGGLSMLLSLRGIVTSYNCIKEKDPNPSLSISMALYKMNKNALKNVISLTLSKSPYEKNMEVDFISMSRKAMQYHGLNDLKEHSYKEFFC